MKKIFSILVLTLLMTSCSNDDTQFFENIALRGGFIQFAELPTLSFSAANAATAVLIENLVDPNNNATRYELYLEGEDASMVDPIVSISSFPAELRIPISTLAARQNISVGSITTSTRFNLIAIVVTPTGTFSGRLPQVSTTRTNNVNVTTVTGGNTNTRLTSSAIARNAVRFRISFN